MAIRGKPILASNGIIVSFPFIGDGILAAIGCRDRVFVAARKGFRQEDVEIGVVIFVLLNKGEWLAVLRRHALHPQSSEKVEWDDTHPVRKSRKTSGCLSRKVGIFFNCCVQLLMLDMDTRNPCSSAKPAPIVRRNRERSPYAGLLFAVSPQFDVIPRPRGVNGVQHLVVIVLAVNERHKQSAGSV